MAGEELNEQDFRKWVEEIIHFIYKKEGVHPINRVRVTCVALARIIGATATDRAALNRGMDGWIDLIKEGADLYMRQRERGKS